MRILNFHTVLDEQDLIVKGNLVSEKRYKGSRVQSFKVMRFKDSKFLSSQVHGSGVHYINRIQAVIANLVGKTPENWTVRCEGVILPDALRYSIQAGSIKSN